MARSRTPTERLLGPVKTALQLAPPSVLLKAPAVPVPAYTVEGALGSMASAPTTGACNPVLTMLQLSPPSVDRKSTRLNSSHGYISYAVFCLKKKKQIDDTIC